MTIAGSVKLPADAAAAPAGLSSVWSLRRSGSGWPLEGKPLARSWQDDRGIEGAPACRVVGDLGLRRRRMAPLGAATLPVFPAMPRRGEIG
jgi:hypothetical protein